MDKSTQTNPHELRVEESYELITGLKKLFNESSPAEQVRLITIALKNWCRRKTERWCVNRVHLNGGSIWLFSVFFLLGFNQQNVMHIRRFSFETITKSSPFLNIFVTTRQSLKKQSLLSSNSIKKMASVAFQQIQRMSFKSRRNQLLFVSWKWLSSMLFESSTDGILISLDAPSTFHSLWPRNVKIVAPHETCMCIYHENMHLLLQVSKFTIGRLLKILKFFCRHGTKTTNGYRSNLLDQQLQNSLWMISFVEWSALSKRNIATLVNAIIVQQYNSQTFLLSTLKWTLMKNAHGPFGENWTPNSIFLKWLVLSILW